MTAAAAIAKDAVAGGDQRTQLTRKPAGAKRKRRSGNDLEAALPIQRNVGQGALKGKEPQERRLAGLSRQVSRRATGQTGDAERIRGVYQSSQRIGR